jgi:hypothetical protein
MKARDRYLKEAFAYVRGRSFHLRIIALGRAICRFQARPPRRLTPFTEALYRAREASGQPLPTDEYTLAKILYSGE